MAGTGKYAHQAERLHIIRLRYCINTHLEDRGLTAPAAIDAAVGLPGAEAVRLLTRRRWREGDRWSRPTGRRGPRLCSYPGFISESPG